ncbi:Peroxidase [Eumeta japonica]|uniref:Peroxidase n=1 Tax=Eumeta variegata TaxID=151549 RepID=A0A4C1WBX1_EUMVA|nr:Peroxidase [Eumeta japonica]
MQALDSLYKDCSACTNQLLTACLDRLLDEERSLTGLARLSDWMNRPLIQEANCTVNFDHLVRGMTTQHEERVDQYVDKEIHTYMFKGNKSVGTDLHAIDIQRSRDHGIPFYIDVRRFFNLSVPTNFKDLTKCCGISPENVEKLKNLYENVNNIELIVGGGLEPLVHGTLSAETYRCMLTEQFKDSRRGDRYFYQNCEDNRFRPEQLQSIQDASIAKVFCDNSEIEYMQPRAFEGVCNDNPLTACHELKGVDLTLWRDGTDKSSKHSCHRSCH